MDAPPALRSRASIALAAGAGLVCGWFVTDRIVFRAFERRIAFEDAVLMGTAEPPYRFRLLWPALGRLGERVVALGIDSRHWQHCLAFGAMTIAVLVATTVLFHALLHRLFAPATALVGTLLLALAVPLSVTGYWVEDDFFTLLAFVAGMALLVRGRDAWLPPLVAVAALNREQAVFLAVLHAIFAATRTQRRWLPVLASFAAWGVTFAVVRWSVGAAPTRFTVGRHLAENADAYHLLRTTLPLWIAQFGVVAALAIASYRTSDRFFRCALLSLVPYIAAFAAFGDLWETAKFLPALVVLLPMAMQTLTAERARLPA